MVKNTREKVSPEPILKNWNEVDEALKEIVMLDCDIEAEENATNEIIVQAKTSLTESVEPLLKKKARLARDIEEFTRENIGRVRTKALNFGSVGLRRTSKLIVKNINDTLKRLKSRKLFDYIRTKEQIDKEALYRFTDDTLAGLGVKRKVEDVFWYETKKEEAVDPEEVK